MRGFLTALFAGGLGLAVLAGPATCPSCDPALTDGQLDAKRILSRLTYTPVAVDVDDGETPALGLTEGTVRADRGEPPPLTELALVEPESTASPISTSALNPAPDPLPETAPAAAAEPEPHAATSPETVEALPEQPPKTEIAAATVESEPEAPLPAVSATALPLKDITAEDSFDPTPSARMQHKHVTVKQRAAKVRKAARRNTAPRLYSPNKYAQMPGWAAKMYESPWQTKAFSFQ